MLLEEIGVKKVINAWGTVTVLGGTILSPEVIEAMREASRVYIDMKDLQKKACNFIAEMLGVEAVCISSGAAAGLVLSAAACVTGGDIKKILDLPNTPYARNKIIVQRLHHNGYLNIVRTAGVNLVEIGSEKETTSEDLRNILEDSVAAVLYFAYDPQRGALPLEEVLRISHEKRVPVIVDAAAELPPVENLQKFSKMGADLTVFSGGKAIGGPNDTGLIIGRKDLIETCMRLEYYENVGAESISLLGRSMKVSKEDVLAIVTALRQYLKRDHKEEMRIWESKVDYMVSSLSQTNLPRARKVYPDRGPRPLVIPRVSMDFSGSTSGMKAEELSEKLRKGDPPIYVYVKDNVLFLNPQCLQDGEEKIIVSKMAAISVPSQ